MSEKKMAKIANRKKATAKVVKVAQVCENGCIKMDRTCSVFGQMPGMYARRNACAYFSNGKATTQEYPSTYVVLTRSVSYCYQ